MEKFKWIPGYEEHYKINNKGDVLSVKGKLIRILKQGPIKGGYLGVCLSVKGKVKLTKIHRLVMLTFDPKDNHNDLTVDHLDENKHNNNLGNLEWVSAKENYKRYADNLETRTGYRGPKGTMMSDDLKDCLVYLKDSGISFVKLRCFFSLHRNTLSKIYNTHKKSLTLMS